MTFRFPDLDEQIKVIRQGCEEYQEQLGEDADQWFKMPAGEALMKELQPLTARRHFLETAYTDLTYFRQDADSLESRLQRIVKTLPAAYLQAISGEVGRLMATKLAVEIIVRMAAKYYRLVEEGNDEA